MKLFLSSWCLGSGTNSAFLTGSQAWETGAAPEATPWETTGLGQWPRSWKVDIERDHGGRNDRPTLSQTQGRLPPPNRPPPPGTSRHCCQSIFLSTPLTTAACPQALQSGTSKPLPVPLGGSSAPHRTAPATAAQAQRSSTECGTLHPAHSRKDGLPISPPRSQSARLPPWQFGSEGS